MLCRCVRECFMHNRLYEPGQEVEFPSCPDHFVPVGGAAEAEGAEPDPSATEPPQDDKKAEAETEAAEPKGKGRKRG